MGEGREAGVKFMEKADPELSAHCDLLGNSTHIHRDDLWVKGLLLCYTFLIILFGISKIVCSEYVILLQSGKKPFSDQKC